ncbi:MAG TPA: STAS domain-containing protein [Acidimicrobiia bacterium]|nr:STAS domain-containing protein [Acidimicrobiia bacterium]
MIPQEMVQVRLRQLPVDLWTRARAHQEAIRREFDLMRASEPADSVPLRLLDLVEDFDARFGDFGDPWRGQLTAAAERGQELTDLTFEVPAPVAAAARELATMLSEVDEFCRAGDHLMTLATPPDLVSFREWLIDELTRQIDGGGEPLPWPEYQREMSNPSSVPSQNPAANGGGSETIAFEGSLDLDTVGELRETIQEIRARDPSEIVVDLTGVGFIDSVGIGLLITTHTRLEEEGVKLRLIVSPRLRGLLELSGLIELLRPEEAPPT